MCKGSDRSSSLDHHYASLIDVRAPTGGKAPDRLPNVDHAVPHENANRGDL